MRRGANLAISQWFIDPNSPERWRRAACVNHQHLPWTHDTMPSQADMNAMRAICQNCPLIMQCAEHAMTQRIGGFYAGVWIPWSSPSESRYTKSSRRHARRHLGRILGIRLGRPAKAR